MTDAEKSSIFDEASKAFEKKKKNNSSSSTSRPVTDKPSSSSPNQPPLKVEEAQEIINRIRHLSEDIEVKLDTLYKDTGLSGSKLQGYFSDSRNFTPEVWEKIEAGREKFEAKIWGTLGLSYKKRKVRQDEKSTKERKGKTLGGRRNWIPIR